MRTLIIALLATFAISPVAVSADLHVGDLPSASTWYLHINFKEMRGDGAGEKLYAWLDDEVFEEIEDDVDFDFGREIDELTAYSVPDSGPVVLLQGPISPGTEKKLLDAAKDEGEVAQHDVGGLAYHFYTDDDDHISTHNVEIDSFDDGAYISFALPNKIVITPSKRQMEEMLLNGGRISGSGSHDGALFVLSAERNLVQAGANTEQLRRSSDDWDSKILSNTRQLALLVADVDGKIAIDARLEAAEPRMVDSIANVARGLIGLASFSNDMEPGIAELLRSTRIDVDDSVLKISVAMDPDAFVSILDD